MSHKPFQRKGAGTSTSSQPYPGPGWFPTGSKSAARLVPIRPQKESRLSPRQFIGRDGNSTHGLTQFATNESESHQIKRLSGSSNS